MSAPIVEIKDVSFSYGKKNALENINLQIQEGATGLLGLNGAGKTTLIQILLGLLPLQKGSLRLFGQEGSLSLKNRTWVGYMPETTPLIPKMSGVEMTAYLGRLSGLPAKDALIRAHEALFYVKLGGERYRLVNQYSEGMRQRLKLAQAIVHGPRLLILDEPTNGLDPLGREELLALINDLKTKGISIILCSHLLPDVESTCSSVIVLNQGKIAKTQTLQRKESVRLEVRVKENADLLSAALQERGWNLKMTKDRALMVDQDPSSAGVIFQEAYRLGLQIRYIMPIHESLEDIFVDAIAAGGR